MTVSHRTRFENYEACMNSRKGAILPNQFFFLSLQNKSRHFDDRPIVSNNSVIDHVLPTGGNNTKSVQALIKSGSALSVHTLLP